MPCRGRHRRNARFAARADRRAAGARRSIETACTRSGPVARVGAKRIVGIDSDPWVPIRRTRPRRRTSRTPCSPATSAPSSSSDAAVSDSKNVPSAPLGERSAIATVSSTSKPRSHSTPRLNGDDLAQHRAQRVDLVDHVDEDRASAGPATPVVGRVEVAVDRRLAIHGAADDADEPAELAGPDHADRFVHDRTVAPHVADEQRHAGRFCGVHEPPARFDGVRERLLDQHRHARRDAREPLLDVQCVGRGDDEAVGLVREPSASVAYSGTPYCAATAAAFGPGSTTTRKRTVGVRLDLFDWRTPIRPAPTTAMRSAGSIYLCLNSGFCFSTNAFMPIFWSSVANSEWKSLRSKWTPSESVPS